VSSYKSIIGCLRPIWFVSPLLLVALMLLPTSPIEASSSQDARTVIAGTVLNVTVSTKPWRVPLSTEYLRWTTSNAPIVATASRNGTTQRTWAIPAFGVQIGKSMRFVSYDTKSQIVNKPDIFRAKYPLRPIQVNGTSHTAIQDFSIPFGRDVDMHKYVVHLRLTVKNNVASVSFRHPSKPGDDIAVIH